MLNTFQVWQAEVMRSTDSVLLISKVTLSRQHYSTAEYLVNKIFTWLLYAEAMSMFMQLPR